MTISFPNPSTHVHLYLAVAAVVLATMLAGRVPILRTLMSVVTVLGMGALLLVTFDQRAGLDPRLARLGSFLHLAGQEVIGRETRVPMSADGQFWVTVSIDGMKRRMLVDTGATATTVSERTANAAGLAPQDGLLPVLVHTANGTIAAQTATVKELRVGNIVAHDVEVVVSPGMGDLDVIGMNFLSRLKGWRVEDGTLMLTPHHPQDVRDSN